MIDCLLLKSSAAIAAGGVSYTSQNLCQALRFKNFAYSTRFALTFDPFGPSSLRGGHFSDFQLRVKHHFTMFFTSFFITTRVAFASPRRHGAHYREFLKPCNREIWLFNDFTIVWRLNQRYVQNWDGNPLSSQRFSSWLLKI